MRYANMPIWKDCWRRIGWVMLQPQTSLTSQSLDGTKVYFWLMYNPWIWEALGAATKHSGVFDLVAPPSYTQSFSITEATCTPALLYAQPTAHGPEPVTRHCLTANMGEPMECFGCKPLLPYYLRYWKKERIDQIIWCVYVWMDGYI